MPTRVVVNVLILVKKLTDWKRSFILKGAIREIDFSTLHWHTKIHRFISMVVFETRFYAR